MNQRSQNLYEQLPQGYHRDPVLGPVYKSAPSASDDLTILRGIGTRETVALNGLGIYFLPQIALWDHRALCAIGEELGVNTSSLLEEQWVEQAQAVCRPNPAQVPESVHLPASRIRTLSLIACAVVIGCACVYWLGQRDNQPFRGVLAADITSLRVPTDAVLVTSHVAAGDEVYSGQPLMTLEKAEHLKILADQQEEVDQLQYELRQAEAKAELDLAWRSRNLDREIYDIQTKANLIQQVRKPLNSIRQAQLEDPATTGSFYQVSQSTQLAGQRQGRLVGGLMFINGSSDAELPPLPQPTRVAMAPTVHSVPNAQLASDSQTEKMLTVEERSVESRLQSLEQLRRVLPEHVRRAAGVESVRLQYDREMSRLTSMKKQSREVNLLCPAYGRVGQVRYKDGDTLTAGEVMLKILHTDRRYVVLHVPTRRVTEIQPGTIVDLSFPGGASYRGRVCNLPMVAEVTAADGQNLATVRVEPHGRLWPEVPIGSEVDVIIGE